jgi:hypothetical protein
VFPGALSPEPRVLVRRLSILMMLPEPCVLAAAGLRAMLEALFQQP